MNFQESVQTCLRKFFDFQGRASRSEYWYFTLFSIVASVAASLFEPESMSGVFSGLVSLGLFFPSFAVFFRRMHDIDKSGWWWLLWLVPIIGWIVLIVLNVTKGTTGPNRFGDDPLAGHS
ncbi:hypothetical protein VZ95_01560 [Elstera litoralis]|uniref:DUF805 domain-containing protein n=2 Tax=Elstera litoralis TaxID=552518 RepID=A0A0F3IW31_9PROT|nr:hypothetical protein VZ95_01560 [Elstera litoralis]